MARKPRTQVVTKQPVYGPSFRPTPGTVAGARDSDGPNVQYVHRQLVDRLPEYALIMDCVAGEIAVKRHDMYWGNWTQYALFGMPEFAQSNLYNGCGATLIEKYLLKPNPTDYSEENSARYRDYVARAVYYNVTGHTLETFTGAIFLREPVIELPPAIEALQEDISGSGISLIQSAKAAMKNVMSYGRAGLLADFPVKDGPVTQADKNAKRYRSTLTLYEPWKVINWRSRWIDGLQTLTLVVLAEPGLVGADDDFKQDTTEQYRVLRLVNGVYNVEIWRRETSTDGSTGRLVMFSTYTPRDASGQLWAYIPFSFIGAHDNTPTVDKPPMADIAHINVGHYRNSADYEESMFFVGQPTLVLTGLTEDWVVNVLGGKVVMGSRAAVPLQADSDAKLIQAEPNTMASEGMLAKEAQMRALGAKLIDEARVQKTATEAGYDEAASQSVLASSAANVSQAYMWALKQMCRFEGEVNTDKLTLLFELNTELDLTKPSPDSRKQALSEYEAGGITWDEYRNSLRRGGIASEDDEKAKVKIAADPPAAAQLVQASIQKTLSNDSTKP